MPKTIDIDYISKKLKEKNITVTEISEKTGYSRVSIYRYLNKTRVPNINFINKVLELI